MALPTLKSTLFNSSTPRSRPTVYNSTFLPNPQQSFEHLTYLSTPHHQKSKSLSQAVSRELSKLEQDFDYNEQQVKKLSLLEQFELYKALLSSISQTLKFKDEKISRLVLRGVFGCERVVSKLAEAPKIQIKTVEKIVKHHVDTQDFGCQAEVSSPEQDLDYERMKQLSKAAEKIKLSRISNHLETLIDNLNSLKTEIPSPSSSPDMQPLETADPNRYINLKLTVMRENITRILKYPESLKRLKIDKAVQVHIEINSSLMDALESMNNDKELNIFKLRSQNTMTMNDKQKLEDALVKRNNLINALEDQNAEYETELGGLKKEKEGLEEKNEELKGRIEKLEEELKKWISDGKGWKKEIGNLKNLLWKKQKYLQDTLDQLYNAQVMWKIAEKKLKSIEKAYLDKTGEVHKYKDINFFEISQKMGIRKVQLRDIDEEIKENVMKDKDEEYDPGCGQNRFNIVLMPEMSEHTENEQDYFSVAKSRKISRNTSDFYDVSDYGSGQESEVELKPKKPSYRRRKREQVKVEKQEESCGKEKEIKYSKFDEENKIDSGNKLEQFNIRGKVTQIGNEIKGVEDKNEIKNVYNKEKTFENKESDVNEKSNFRDLGVNEKPNSKDIGVKRRSISKDSGVSEKTQLKTSKNETYQINLKETNRDLSLPPSAKQKSKPASTDQASLSQPTKTVSFKPPKPHPTLTPNTNLNINPSIKSDPNSFPLSNSSDPARKSSLAILPETFSEHSNSSPTPTLSLSNNSHPIQKSSILKKPSNSFTSKEKIQVKISANSSSQSNFPLQSFSSTNPLMNALSGINNSGISAFVPSKFVIEERKEKFKENKDEQLTFDQETLSRSLDLDKVGYGQVLSEGYWFEGLSEEQQKSFQIFQEKLEENRRFCVENHSKSVQCLLLDDAGEGISSEKFGRMKEKYKDVLGRVFGDLNEIDLLPGYVKLRIKKCVKGHSNKCAEVCKHLKRVMELKKKIKGLPYPIKIVKM